jgi:hypothetical protein
MSGRTPTFRLHTNTPHPNGISVDLTQADIFHLRGMSLDGVRGFRSCRSGRRGTGPFDPGRQVCGEGVQERCRTRRRTEASERAYRSRNRPPEGEPRGIPRRRQRAKTAAARRRDALRAHRDDVGRRAVAPDHGVDAVRHRDAVRCATAYDRPDVEDDVLGKRHRANRFSIRRLHTAGLPDDVGGIDPPRSARRLRSEDLCPLQSCRSDPRRYQDAVCGLRRRTAMGLAVGQRHPRKRRHGPDRRRGCLPATDEYGAGWF